MINVYATKERLPDGINDIGIVDAVFKSRIWGWDMDNNDKAALRVIDNAKLIDKNVGTIQTRFGIAGMDKISTGCKTVILANHMIRTGLSKEWAIDAIGCGCNALDELFKIADNTDLCVIIHRIPIYDCKWKGELNYNDGEFIGSPFDLDNYTDPW